MRRRHAHHVAPAVRPHHHLPHAAGVPHPHGSGGLPSISLLLRDPGRVAHQLGALAHRLLAGILAAAPWVLLAGAVIGLAGCLLAWRRHRRLGSGARLIELAVPPEVEPERAQLLWSALHDLLRPRLKRLLSGQPHLCWEINASQQGTAFGLWVPGSVPPGLVERAIASAWPGTTTTETEPDQISSERALAACELVLSGPEWFPLGGADGADPLALVLGQLAGLGEGARALVQVLAQPATIRAQRRLVKAARRIRAGLPPSRMLRLLDLLHSTPPAPRTPDPTISPDVRAVLEKASRPLYRCLIRITVTADRPQVARGRIHAIAGAFAAYEGRVGLRRRRLTRARAKASTRWLGRRAYLLSVPELAALAHLPGGEALPGVVRAGARRVPPAPDVPRAGRPLGIADAGVARPVALTVADGRHHLHVLGATGAGKSTAIAQLVLADAAAGRGAVVIDPKGDLVDWILDRLTEPPEPLVVIDPERSTRPVGLNVLQSTDPQLAAEHLVGTFRRLYEQFWGPRTDDILRASVLTLARDPKLTLAEIPTCLANPAWRAPLTQTLANDDPVLAGFWRWYDALSEASRVQAIGPLLNKLRAFLLRRPVRAIVGQEQTSFPLRDTLDHGLLLARLPKGTLGEDTSRLLGGLLVARVWQEALSRSRLPEGARPDSCLYVDEVHNYLALPHSFEDLLAEARGYRLSLCLAHQNLAQLPRPMADALSANARTKLIFTCSPEDARVLERHTAPELSAHDLANLARHQAACRTLAHGQDQPAFTLTTTRLPAGGERRGQRLRAQAEGRFGRDPRWVERRLRARQLRVLAGGKHADGRDDRSADKPGDSSADRP
jgi:hypothetical protein